MPSPLLFSGLAGDEAVLGQLVGVWVQLALGLVSQLRPLRPLAAGLWRTYGYGAR